MRTEIISLRAFFFKKNILKIKTLYYSYGVGKEIFLYIIFKYFRTED